MEVYEKYLEIIDAKLAKFFEQQHPYICCKEGCSLCCETGEYPFSKTEFDYLMVGYEQQPDDIKFQIQENIDKIKNEKKAYKDLEASKDQKFLHACPFLINNSCCVYKYRALICRSYGLMSFYQTKEGEQRYKMPFCVSKGLNYSKVYDEDEGTFTTEKWKQSGIEVEPVSYNVSLKYLLDNNLTQYLNLDLKEQKALLDWFD